MAKVDTDRVVDSVKPPASLPLDSEDLFDADNIPNIENLLDHFGKEGLLLVDDALEIINRVGWIYEKEPNVLIVDDPVTVCGDLHGQYYDLLKLFEVGGKLGTETSYLFLGDYVDRGCFACEIVLLMFCLKIKYPTQLFMLRGNHETRHLSAHFNFKQEAIHKYGEEVYSAFMNCFDKLPLAAIVSKKFFCCHGGLSPQLRTIDDIQSIDRFREPPSSGAYCDLLWSDPHEDYDEDETLAFTPNTTRGCSYNYGYSAVVSFLEENSLLCMLRGHEVQDQGYKILKKHPEKKFPTVITLFSAPNYIDSFNNKGAVLLYRNNVMKITSFFWSEHPYNLPNFMDGFSWSLPFVAEKTFELLCTIVNVAYEDIDVEDVNVDNFDLKEHRRHVMRKKIVAMSKMMRMYSVLQRESVAVGQLKDLTKDHKLPVGLLSAGPTAIRDELTYQRAMEADLVNLKRPAMPEKEETESS